MTFKPDDHDEAALEAERIYKREYARRVRGAKRDAERPQLLSIVRQRSKLPTSTADERAARRRLIRRGAPMAERIRAWVRVTEAGCWEWRGKRSGQGYGRICVSREKGDAQVHRVSYETFVGPIPTGAEIHHKCSNRPCCNPDHLEPLSARENTRLSSSPAARNHKKTRCLRGHALASPNLYVTTDGRRQCRECRRQHHRRYARNKHDTVEIGDTEFDPERHTSHFASCPAASKFRRPR